MSHTFPFTVDQNPYISSSKHLTPSQMMLQAGIDPATNYLVDVTETLHASLRDQNDAEINLKQDSKFVSVYFGPNRDFDYRLDGEEYESPEKKITPNQMLINAGLNTAEYYVVEVEGKKHHSYEGEGDKIINLKKENDFITVFTGPVTVSYGGATGQKCFAEQLEKLGYEVKLLGDNVVQLDYVVQIGKYAGSVVPHAFVIQPDFPLTPPGGPHVYSNLHPLRSDGNHPTGGIHASQSPHLGAGWQYWSRPCNAWASSPKNAATYMAFLRTIWATQ